MRKSPRMPSNSRTKLDVALADVDAQIKHAVSFAGGTRGAPAAVAGVARPGRPFTRAATVLLAAAFEGYVESLVTETATHLALSAEQVRDLKTLVGRSHGSNIHHIHGLFATVGMPFVLDEIRWRGLPRGAVRTFVKDLSSRRNKIAHGTAPENARLADVQRWRKLVERLSNELDKKAADRVFSATNARPW